MVESRHTMDLKRMLRQATTAPPSFLPVSTALMAHLHVRVFGTFIINSKTGMIVNVLNKK